MSENKSASDKLCTTDYVQQNTISTDELRHGASWTDNKFFMVRTSLIENHVVCASENWKLNVFACILQHNNGEVSFLKKHEKESLTGHLLSIKFKHRFVPKFCDLVQSPNGKSIRFCTFCQGPCEVLAGSDNDTLFTILSSSPTKYFRYLRQTGKILTCARH